TRARRHPRRGGHDAADRRALGEARRPRQPPVAAHQRGGVVPDENSGSVYRRHASRADFRLWLQPTAYSLQPLRMKHWLRLSITVLACALLLIYVVDEHAVLQTL